MDKKKNKFNNQSNNPPSVWLIQLLKFIIVAVVALVMFGVIALQYQGRRALGSVRRAVGMPDLGEEPMEVDEPVQVDNGVEEEEMDTTK
jgi:Sec-independent protein translocase protein TatA